MNSEQNLREKEDKNKRGQAENLSSSQLMASSHKQNCSPLTAHRSLIDTHSHIDMPDFEDLDKIIFNAQNAGVEKIIIPSVDKNSFEKVIRIANKYEGVYCALGIHPSEAKGAKDEDFEEIINLIEALSPPAPSPLAGEGEVLGELTSRRNSGEGYNPNKIIAIGECGLDYYWDKSFVDEQKRFFAKQIEIAVTLKKPLIVHDREAHHDTFEMLKDVKDVPVIMHCFSGSWEFAKECIKKGFYIAIGGVVTFKNAKKVHEIAKNIPLEHLLLETDAPYLTPEPFRGKRNEPAYVKFAAEKIAELRGVSFEEIAQATTKNANAVFKI